MEAEQAKRLDDGEPVAISIAELVAWRQRSCGSRLLLPPIQRSLVWTNKQIIEYWDSLLRGYPPGLMLVHRTRAQGNDGGNSAGIDQNGKVIAAGEDDYHLFDGQQRMAAILLGLGEGPLDSSLRLWVDLDASPSSVSGLWFQLRISSRGQPFGYQPAAPNEKFKVSRRRDQWKLWERDHPHRDPFFHSTGAYLIEHGNVVELKTLWAEATAAIAPIEGDETRTKFVGALRTALKSRVILQMLSGSVVDDPKEYTRFFGRYGQGGTRLSNDELTYSIIKNLFPLVRERIEIIIGDSGRLVSEVDLVLAAMRVAKVERPWKTATPWEIVGRPDPGFAARLGRDAGKDAVESYFLHSIDDSEGLERAMRDLRSSLEYNHDSNPRGLPRILLARLPRELLDVLLLIVARQSPAPLRTNELRDSLITFVLHWLLFVSNGEKAANQIYMKVYEGTWVWQRESISALWREFEREGVAHVLPDSTKVHELKEDLGRQTTSLVLRSWPTRFSGIDREGDSPGSFLRILSTHRELSKRVLLWLQREEITRQFPRYDPTSGRDEDLPIDLDHIIPNATFDFDWRQRGERLDNAVHTDNFRHQRDTVGNSLGNFRWLAASDNRSRGMDNDARLKADEADRDLIQNYARWNMLIPEREEVVQRKWGESEVASFQYLIDQRTLLLYERLILESGIDELSRQAARIPD